jgi:tetratricopeptide (TPR) repeat protein
MWTIFIIVGSVTGLLYIFSKKYKETKRLERVKVKTEARKPQSIHNRNAAGQLAWKKKSLDYKAIHEAFNKADLYYDKGEIDDAQKGFIQVLALHPDHEEANNKLGLIYVKKNMNAKAEAIFRRLIDINPQNPVFYSNLGLALCNQEHYDEALESYQKAISLSPRTEAYFVKMAEIYKVTDKNMAAVNAYSRALEINNRNHSLYFLASEILVKLKAYKEAIAYLEGLLEIQPYNEEAKSLIRKIKIDMGASPLSGRGAQSKAQEPDQPQMF